MSSVSYEFKKLKIKLTYIKEYVDISLFMTEFSFQDWRNLNDLIRELLNIILPRYLTTGIIDHKILKNLNQMLTIPVKIS